MKTALAPTIAILVVAVFELSAATHYVDLTSTNATPPYTNWLTAATNIQDAVDAAMAGDEVVVANGIYATGGRAVSGLMTNRVAVDRPITLRSVNGPQFTFIQGFQLPGTNNGDGAIRCVYLTNNANLFGFTLTNGATRAVYSSPRESYGGGIWCESRSSVISNCVIVGCFAYEGGGGAHRGTLKGCTVVGNRATYRYGAGGGVDNCELSDCLLVGNEAMNGGGASGSRLENCLLRGNSAGENAGGATGCTLINCTVTGNSALFGGGVMYVRMTNCIVYFNTATLEWPNFYEIGATLYRHCCTTPMPEDGVGNITNPPLFYFGNLLSSLSPCINAGDNDQVTTATDLDGNPRVVSGTVDMGAYEYQGAGSRISYAWLQQYGLPTDGLADFIDSDGDGLNNWQEWVCNTRPTSALSALRLISATPAGANVTVSWQSASDVNYFLERSANLQPPFTLVASNIVGHSDTTVFTHTNAADAGPFFYRVGVKAR